MHYRCEIVMPPTDNIESAIEKIMAPYRLWVDDSPSPFWDWYTIGGYYSGRKLTEAVDSAEVNTFSAWLKQAVIPVVGIMTGEPKISSPELAELVDAKWREMFPDSPLQQCPYFLRSGNALPGDILPLSESMNATCFTAIFASADLERAEIFHKEVQVGAKRQDAAWDGKSLKTALEWHNERLNGMGIEYADKNRPKPDWLAVTVDYHS